MNFTQVRSYANYIEAHLMLVRLQHEYINCHLKDEFIVTIDPFLTNAVGGIKLMVASSQIERAKELLEVFESGNELT